MVGDDSIWALWAHVLRELTVYPICE